MESDFLPSSEGINGINLANYFPNRRSYNSVVYFHKRLLRDIKEEETNDIKHNVKLDKEKSKKKKSNHNLKQDKSQQFNCESINKPRYKYETDGTANNSVLDQTIRFAKNLVPLVLPKESEPVFYTIKSSKKHRKHTKKRDESSIEQDITYNKGKKKKYDSAQPNITNKETSLRESIDPSSQNTLDDVHININHSCSFSESTEVKFHKKGPNHKIANESCQKFFVSNSFEALATESLVDGSKIKIHLMNDADKDQFSASIQNPIINTIKDYLTQSNVTFNKDINTDLNNMQKLIKSNSQKLDDILEKLSRIQTKMDAKQPLEVAKPRIQSAGKASKLEELGQDIIEIKKQSTSEDEDFTEEYNSLLQRRRHRGKSLVVAIEKDVKEDKKKDSLGCGEEVPGPLTTTGNQLGVKPERPNKIPARFCWTDADRKK